MSSLNISPQISTSSAQQKPPSEVKSTVGPQSNRSNVQSLLDVQTGYSQDVRGGGGTRGRGEPRGRALQVII